MLYSIHNFVRKRERTQYTVQHFGNLDLRNTTDFTNGSTSGEGEHTVNEQSTDSSFRNY